MTVSHGIWAFRTASSPARGAGHVARCLALAAALPGRKHFFLDPDDVFAGRIEQAGHACTPERSREDATRLLDFTRSTSGVGVIVDSYDLGPAAIAGVSALPSVLKLDDGIGPAYGNAVLNAAVESDERYSHLPPERCFFGPKFALLPPEYAAVNRDARVNALARKRGEPAKILIAMGARDSKNITMLAMKACRKLDIGVTVAIGPHADHLDAVRDFCASQPNWTLAVGSTEMIEHYVSHDLAVGAGGQSLYERMASGLPSIVVTLSDNQAGLVAAAERTGACRHAGLAERLDPDSLGQSIRDLLDDSAAYDALRRTGLDFVDGQGAARAADRLSSQLGMGLVREISL